MCVGSVAHTIFYDLDEPIYDRLDNRGYDPIQQPRHQPAQQYAGQQPNIEPLYGQLNTQQARMPYPTQDSTMRGVGPPQDWALPIRAQGPEQSSRVGRPPLAPQMFMGIPDQWDQPLEQPPAPPPQPKKKEKVGWVCVGCTFINKPRRPGCELCGTARPEDFVIPEDCPLDDDELRILRGQEENEKLFLQVCVCVCLYMCECVVHASMCHFVLCVSLHEFAGKLFQWERLGRVR